MSSNTQTSFPPASTGAIATSSTPSVNTGSVQPTDNSGAGVIPTTAPTSVAPSNSAGGTIASSSPSGTSGRSVLPSGLASVTPSSSSGSDVGSASSGIPSATSSAASSNSNKNATIALGALFGVAAVAAVMFAVLFFSLKRRHRRSRSSDGANIESGGRSLMPVLNREKGSGKGSSERIRGLEQQLAASRQESQMLLAAVPSMRFDREDLLRGVRNVNRLILNIAMDLVKTNPRKGTSGELKATLCAVLAKHAFHPFFFSYTNPVSLRHLEQGFKSKDQFRVWRSLTTTALSNTISSADKVQDVSQLSEMIQDGLETTHQVFISKDVENAIHELAYKAADLAHLVSQDCRGFAIFAPAEGETFNPNTMAKAGPGTKVKSVEAFGFIDGGMQCAERAVVTV